MVAHPREKRTMLDAVRLAVAELLQISLCPFGLFWNGEVEVGDIGGLQKRVTPLRPISRDDNHGTESQSTVCRQLSSLQADV